MLPPGSMRVAPGRCLVDRVHLTGPGPAIDQARMQHQEVMKNHWAMVVLVLAFDLVPDLELGDTCLG